MSKLSFRARALDASKPMPIYLAEELPDLPDYSAINRAVPQMPSGMEKEEESEHHLQRAISGTGLIIPTPEVCQVIDLEFYERCYPPDYKMPKQHIHMQPLWEEQEAPEYDIDSEDERWLKQQRHPELTELKFEQMMDKLEKSSGQTVVTLNEAKLLLERHDDLVIAVYDYWLNKRLNTQHPLILSVKTENRPGQSTNNPYLAFRRRTEKMQTRKNRKNDESSYEKMLKLRRDLARALTLLELVARREAAKRDLLRLTALLADRRYLAGDFAHQLLPDPPPRPQYTAVPLSSSSYRREAYTLPHYPARPPATPIDQPRQREKRSYKKRKHRHPVAAAPQGLRDSGVYTSSEEEGSPRTEAASPPDDGPFAFRRKPGCYYEMPTTTLCGDPVDPDSPSKEGLFQHEIDERHRYTLASLEEPYPRCVGFVRRRLGRGGRVALDRRATPLDDLWPRLPFDFPDSSHYRRLRDEEVELETKAHRTPKEMTRDYHSGGKYPWRHAFRHHLARHPELWTVDVKNDVKMDAEDVKIEIEDVKISVDDVKIDVDDVKLDVDDVKIDVEEIDDVKIDVDKLSGDEKLTVDDIKMDVDECKNDSVLPDSNKSDISVSARTIDNAVRENLGRVIRKRSWSGCTDSSYDSDESLYPVEKEFDKFINEVNMKWLHFRPKTPPPSPPYLEPHDSQYPLTRHTPIAVELRPAETPPDGSFDCFTTAQFTLADLCSDIAPRDLCGSVLADGIGGLSSERGDTSLSEVDLRPVAGDRKVAGDILDELVNNVQYKDPFLVQGQRCLGRAGAGVGGRGSSVVSVRSPRPDPIYIDKPQVVVKRPVEAPVVKEEKKERKVKKEVKAEPAPVPTHNIIVEEVNELVPQINVDRKRKDDTIEEVTLPHGVQLKTVHTKHSPLKKHIITSAAHRRPSDVTLVTSAASSAVTSHDTHTTQLTPHQPQIVTVAVSESLKVRLQNQLGHGSGSVVVGNGPFPGVVALPVHSLHHNHVSDTLTVGSAGTVSVSSAVGGVVAARRAAPLVQLAPARRAAPSLKVVSAAPLPRAALLARGLQLGPAVVSLAALDKPPQGLLKAPPGSVAQLIEIKPGQLAKGPHLVNVVRHPHPQVHRPRAPPDPSAPSAPPAHRVAVSVEGRTVVRGALSSVRAAGLRHQLQLRTKALQPTTIPATAIPTSVMHNLLHKGVQLPAAGAKIGISHAGHGLAANVQAIAFTAAQLKVARASRLSAARPTPPPAPPAAPPPAPPAAPPDPTAPDEPRRRETHVT